MPRLRTLPSLCIAALLLTGCAAVASDDAAVPTAIATVSPTPSGPAADPAAAARVDGWVAGAILPAGAVEVEYSDDSPAPKFLGYYGWPCSPLELRTAYWTVPGAKVTETINAIADNPGPGLIGMGGYSTTDGPEPDGATTGQWPELGSLEGISWSVQPTDDGVIIRGEFGAFRSDTACPPNSDTFGGPGQG